jgi:hypothetical protein
LKSPNFKGFFYFLQSTKKPESSLRVTVRAEDSGFVIQLYSGTDLPHCRYAGLSLQMEIYQHPMDGQDRLWSFLGCSAA